MIFGFRVICTVFFVLPLVVFAQGVSIKLAPAFSKIELTEAPTNGWLTNGGDLYNRRYSPLTQINRRTIGECRLILGQTRR